MLRRRTFTLLGTMLAGALIATASPAPAMSAAGTTSASPTNLTRISTAAPATVPRSFDEKKEVTVRESRLPREQCFYHFTFKDDTHWLQVDWDGGGIDECFGIAPDKSIWHAWSNSGGWREMPGRGKADDTDWAWLDGGSRNVRVVVHNDPYTYWCSTYTPGSGSGWSPSWYQCYL